MFGLGLIFVLAGIGITVLNRLITARLSEHRRHAVRFSSSVTRQNIAIIGAVFVIGGTVMLFLSYLARVNE